ncbi:MAG: response regulator [Candidatus Magnetobacterium sp. LHC-1]|nr:response regulator [Nitrospirota bacterium]
MKDKVNTSVRALIIEDDNIDVELVDEYLSLEESDFKLEVETAGRLSEGLERLSKGDIDVVLLDLTLPDSNGLDTFIALHSRFSGVPIVYFPALTAANLPLRPCTWAPRTIS